MKRFLKALPGTIAGIVGILLAAGCANQFSPPAQEALRQGMVTIYIEDGNPRTLLPQAPEFSRYELQFTPGSGQAAKNPESVTVGTSPTVTLAEGDWTITAIAYVDISGITGIPDNEYEAARGSNNLHVIAEQNHNVGIDIRGGTETGKGIFSYALSYPADVSVAALKILSFSGASIEEVNLKEAGLSGSLGLDAGYYILRLELEKEGGKIVKVEAIHIYKNLTTAAEGTDYAFTDTDFLFAVDTDANVTAGTMTPYIAGGIFFNMAAVPGGISFPTGTDDSGTAVVRTPYQIGETEVTWELWDTVRTWALSNGYSNISQGRQGKNGSGGNQQPVTMVTRYSMAVWCNALTEYWNVETGASLATVYNSGGNPIRNASDTTALNNVTPLTHTRGFRLLTSNEWELAARWQGQTDRGNSVEKNGYYFTKGNSASGASGSASDAAATGNVAVYQSNSGNTTAVVKSKLPNALGLYDMSGNVWERCFDRGGPNNLPIRRGASCGNSTDYIQLGNTYYDNYYDSSDDIGFRLARTGYKAGEIVPPSELNVPITINFTGPDEEDITITGDLVFSIGDSIVFSAPAGYAAYQWIIDNVTSSVTANAITLPAGSLALGPHSVTLVIYKQEGSVQVPYSKTLTFTVEP